MEQTTTKSVLDNWRIFIIIFSKQMFTKPLYEGLGKPLILFSKRRYYGNKEKDPQDNK